MAKGFFVAAQPAPGAPFHCLEYQPQKYWHWRSLNNAKVGFPALATWP
jgi:hypothetical protein